MPETQAAVVILFLILAPLAAAGLALMNAGLSRTRNAAHSMMAALCVISVAACVYFVCGLAFAGYTGGMARVLHVAGKPWDWIGNDLWFFRGLPMDSPSARLAPGAPPAFLFAWLGIVSAGLAGVIPLGSGADRWRLGAICGSTALLSGLTFPVFAHWGNTPRRACRWRFPATTRCWFCSDAWWLWWGRWA
jgi:ammonia channel protein AmtB